MNFELYARPYSSQNLKRNLKIAVPTTSSAFSAYSSHQIIESSKINHENITVTQRNHKIETQAEDFYKSPENSQYQIQLFFPERPKTSHLSGLTLKENEKTIAQNSNITQNKAYKGLGISQSYARLALPSDQDFTKILAKLEMVSANRSGSSKRILLNDNDSTEIILEPGEVQYFTINSKNQKPPLVVSLRRSKGKITSFVSKINPEPMRGMCDGVFKVDNFQISDVSVRFKMDAVFLGIESTNEAIFTISVSFGSKLMKRMSTLKFTQEEQEIINKPELEKTAPLSTRKSLKKTTSNKDFIKININEPKKLLSPREILYSRTT